jgi:hypothetical protein
MGYAAGIVTALSMPASLHPEPAVMVCAFGRMYMMASAG